MAEVQVPTPADAVSDVAQPSGVDKDALITRLDTLLEQYLYTLDEYEKLMQQLSKQLSSGYFSLTQANFHNRSGVHYGQDSYDERVQATRKIVVTEDVDCSLRYSTTPTLPSTFAKSEKDTTPTSTEAAKDENVEKTKDDDTAAGATPRREKSKENDVDDGAEEESDTAKSTVVDPIRMFGILVPPALRSAQVSFREAVDGPVVRLAEVTGELRALEREIGRARKSIRKA
ncbi:hypothetical protein BU25DRAFT_449714 [Macroventuria anomochaeta]|uniref:Uncharacterized protein n=1 Tax=Macroventuria anomochaeta TaxID=301207 RepID=A0ACB6RXN2_9PLEO|nr:uncharacterized protein BU25DRAFT_449714 [Macroventuria anomochaeta]KAF2626022.1 hypothetical protein BU25DRAFT_449714 [Macroventuria anomochaeta]